MTMTISVNAKLSKTTLPQHPAQPQQLTQPQPLAVEEYQSLKPNQSNHQPGSAYCLIVLDQSARMAELYRPAEPIRKADLATLIGSQVLAEFQSLQNEPEDLVVSVLCYGNSVTSGLVGAASPKTLVSIRELEDYRLDRPQIRQPQAKPSSAKERSSAPAQDDGTGPSKQSATGRLPIWVRPQAQGKQTLADTAEPVSTIINRWLERSPRTVPPVILHISGQAEGAETLNPWQSALESAKQQGTLVFHCCLSGGETAQVSFPQQLNQLPSANHHALMQASSRLPHAMVVSSDAGDQLEDAYGLMVNPGPSEVQQFSRLLTRFIAASFRQTAPVNGAAVTEQPTQSLPMVQQSSTRSHITESLHSSLRVMTALVFWLLGIGVLWGCSQTIEPAHWLETSCLCSLLIATGLVWLSAPSLTHFMLNCCGFQLVEVLFKQYVLPALGINAIFIFSITTHAAQHLPAGLTQGWVFSVVGSTALVALGYGATIRWKDLKILGKSLQAHFMPLLKAGLTLVFFGGLLNWCLNLDIDAGVLLTFGIILSFIALRLTLRWGLYLGMLIFVFLPGWMGKCMGSGLQGIFKDALASYRALTTNGRGLFRAAPWQSHWKTSYVHLFALSMMLSLSLGSWGFYTLASHRPHFEHYPENLALYPSLVQERVVDWIYLISD